MEHMLQKKLIEAVAGTVIAHADELTRLDQAIGDGDHGLNMKRGFEAVLADAEGLSVKPLPDALKAIGTQLVMKIGGASGRGTAGQAKQEEQDRIASGHDRRNRS